MFLIVSLCCLSLSWSSSRFWCLSVWYLCEVGCIVCGFGLCVLMVCWVRVC